MGLAKKLGLMSGSSGFQQDKVGRSISNYQTRLSASGFGYPQQNKDSTLTSVGRGVLKGLDYLNRPLDAVEVGLKYAGQGRNPLQGAWQGLSGKETYRGAEMLQNLGGKSKTAQGVGGFVIDMALDPLNAVTFGAGSLLKGVVKGGASVSEKGLVAAENLAREQALREARLAVQREHGVTSFKGLAKKFEGADRAHQADAAIKAKAFEGTTEQEFLRNARQSAQQRAGRSAGKGLSVFGKSIISGAKMQDAGGKVNTLINKLPGAEQAGEALSKALNPSFVKGLDTGEQEVLRQITSKNQGANAVRDIQDAEKFRNLAALQRGVTIGGKPVDRQIMDIISTRGEGVPEHEWGRIITTTDRQKAAAIALGLPEYATIKDLVELYKSSYLGIGMKELSEGVLGKLTKNYVPHIVNREFDDRLRKGSMTRNFNVRNEFGMSRKDEYIGKSITEINDIIRKKAQARGEKVADDFEFLETSALNALMTRQLTSNKVLADKHTVDMVLRTFGRPVSKRSEVNKFLYAGYDIVVPNASVNLFNIGRLPKELGSEEAKGLSNVGLSKVDGKAASGIKNIIESNGNVLQKISAYDATNLVGTVNLRMYALPKGMAEKFNRSAKIQIDDGAMSMAKIVDRFYSVWKPLVTGLRPQYHARNLVSSGFNNFLDLGVKMFDPETQRAAALVASAGAGVGRNATINIAGKSYTAKELHELMVQSNALNTFFLTDTNSMSRGISEDIARNNTGKTAQKVLGKPAELGRATGNRVEEYVRAVNFVAHLKQGFTPEEAADMARKYHFDYQELTDFEQSIKKVFPFYTWARKNIPLQVESILNNPTPYLALNRAQQTGAYMTDTDTQDLPDYARRDFAIPIGKSADGRTKVLSPGIPAGDLFFGAKDVAGMLNPLAKIPLEMYTGQNFLTQGSLNSYPQETAIKLGEGNSLVAKGLQMTPFLQAQLEAHPGAATAFQRVLGSAGILSDVNQYAIGGIEGGTLQGSRASNQTGGPLGFAERMVDPNMVKYFDPAKGEQDRNYEYQRQLGNLVQMLKAKGVAVPDMKDLKYNTKLR